MNRWIGLLTLFCAVPSRVIAQRTVVHADNAPLWGSAVRVLPIVTVGSADGPAEYAFGSVDYVVGEQNGGFFLYDSKDTQLRHFDASGKFLGNIGRQGSGPGEYRELLGLALSGDSLLVVWDPRLSRVTYYGVDGKLRHSFMARLDGEFFAADAFAVDRTGRVLLELPPRKADDTVRYVRYRANGTVIDTLSAPQNHGGSPGFMLTTADGGRMNFKVEDIVKASAGGGLVSASTATLGFTISAGGKTLTVTRAHTPVALSAEERAEWQRYAEYFHARATAPSEVVSEIPRVKPALRDVFVDREGRVWLDVYTAATQRTNVPLRALGDSRPRLTWRERSTYDVFSLAGQYLGRVVLPADYQMLDVSGDRVWTLTNGADDEEKVVVFRIVHQ